ncbi:MAG: hypothetical protein EWV61_01830, partial [Microcystis aeruginosa Ma_AC_P_19900807_S300]
MGKTLHPTPHTPHPTPTKNFLPQTLVRDAIKVVSDNSYVQSHLIWRIMDAAATVDPDWVIDHAR